MLNDVTDEEAHILNMDFEDIEDIENVESVEDVEGAKDIEGVKDEGAEDVESVEDVKDTQATNSGGNSEMVEDRFILDLAGTIGIFS
ncbi:hypothetical protein DL765_009345 [Monosporascus sp. GIB2]|nr:hypothetical protein DL765_009345 [Monosporascus sp. GIB2]